VRISPHFSELIANKGESAVVNNIETFRHKEWLGLLQPVGLVVSPPALVKAQAVVNRAKALELQTKLNEIVSYDPIPDLDTKEVLWLKDFPSFAEKILEWMPEDLLGSNGQESLPDDLEVVLSDYNEILRPSYAIRDPDNNTWLMLVQEVSEGLDLDEVDPKLEKGRSWKVTIQEKFERLLRETKIPIGILWNGIRLRLVYAPQGESSGHLTFPIQAMCEVQGRLILGALDMLLGADRLFNVPTERRLPKILSDSREYQAEVSTKLADQVLDALWGLLRGFQTADAAVNGKLLDELAKTNPQHIYGGIITTLMRLVFLLDAEDQGLMPGDDIYQRNYSVTGLYERLREEASSYPDTIDQRYGAWAWLLSLVRLVYDGGGDTTNYLPARHGQLFDPNEYPFLEGRRLGTSYREFDCIEPPRIPDGTIYRILENLLILDGERLSYRSLDVEQIGSVYSAIMGFEVEVAKGISIAVRPKDVVVNIDNILAAKSKDREKFLQDADCKLTGKSLTALKEAKTAEEIVAAIDRRVSSRTPNLLPVGSLYLQPGQERRRSGSHYTPRKLTQPIVETTLRPVLQALGDYPTAEQILSLKVCDLAMGSAAFLVEVCRQLAEKVVEAWSRNDELKNLPDDVEPLLVARRYVAQRCLYGVDKNPFAVNLAKLSLWLVTLAKDYPFTFLDHCLKCGDSLVGLNKTQISSFGKDGNYDLPLLALLKEQISRARSLRAEIQSLDTRSDADDDQKRVCLNQIEEQLQEARLIGDVKVGAFFAGGNKKQREEKEREFGELVKNWRYQYAMNPTPSPSPQARRGEQLQRVSQQLRGGEKGVTPFYWEVEFPEVFDRDNSGFDAIVGNPPFLGGKKISSIFGSSYLDWILTVNPEAIGNGDLVGYFFRRAFELLREGGSFGLIATNTIAQGDTRSSSLRYICQNNGIIYNVQKRVKWTGKAAVIVSVINIFKQLKFLKNVMNRVSINSGNRVVNTNIGKVADAGGTYSTSKQIEEVNLPVNVSLQLTLDGRQVPLISAFLFHAGGNENPSVLLENANKSFIGSYVLGMGFTFDDSNFEATPIAEMQRLIEKDPRNAERIFPYIGGEEVNSSPTHAYRRYVINFGEMSEEEARQFPDLMTIVEEKVKPGRENLKRDAYRIRWWQYAEKQAALFKAVAHLNRVLVVPRHQPNWSLAFMSSKVVFSEALVVFTTDKNSFFATIQSRIHETWARFFGSSMKDDLRYTPTDCFETFPFPENWENSSTLEAVGKEYYEFRAELMVRNNKGLTDTYNRFHDPEERDPDIIKLRELHAKMDRAVLDAYGWDDISCECKFLLDYEEEEGENTSRRKKPWRYRWSEEIHDEVLAKLLDLNKQRANAEILGGKKAENKPKAKSGKKKASKASKNAEDLPKITGLSYE
jgi:N-6 DNA Methylase